MIALVTDFVFIINRNALASCGRWNFQDDCRIEPQRTEASDDRQQASGISDCVTTPDLFGFALPGVVIGGGIPRWMVRMGRAQSASEATPDE